jgi:hypothetical protein
MGQNLSYLTESMPRGKLKPAKKAAGAEPAPRGESKMPSILSNAFAGEQMPLVFQYGSNCDTGRLNGPKRLAGAAVCLGLAQTSDEYEMAFDVWSDGNGCATADLVSAPGSGLHVWGVLYEIPADRIRGRKRPDGKKTLEEIEGRRYEERPIKVRDEDGSEIQEPVTTFLVKQDERRQGLWTKPDYVRHIVKGLRDHDIPEEYVQYVIDVAIRTNQQATDRQAASRQSKLIEELRNR